MKLRVLGGDGGVSIGFQTTSFRINESILIDAGSCATALPLKEQRKIDYIFVSHTHLDHIKDICFLADNVFTHRKKPIEIISTPEIIEILQKHFLNNLIWPDFTKISNGSCPILAYRPIEKSTKIGDIEVFIYPVNHPVPAIGFILKEKGKKTVVITGDTGPTDLLWLEANKEKHLKGVFTEIAFPNRLQHVADLAGHFTPQMFKEEMKKLEHDVPLYIYHLKPDYFDALKKEIKALKVPGLKLIKAKQEFRF